MRVNRMRIVVGCLAVLAVGLGAGAAFADKTTAWNVPDGSTGGWWDNSSWSNGVPADHDTVEIRNGGMAVFDNGTLKPLEMRVDTASTSLQSRMVQDGGTMEIGPFGLTIGTLGGDGLYQLNDGNLLTRSVWLADDEKGHGAFHQDGGHHTSQLITIRRDSTYWMSGPGVLETSYLYVSGTYNGKRGHFIQDNGTVWIHDTGYGTDRLMLASTPSMAPGGIYDLNDGTLIAGSIEVGYGGRQGEFHQYGGDVTTRDLNVLEQGRYQFFGGSLDVTGRMQLVGTLAAGIDNEGIDTVEIGGFGELTGTLRIRDFGAVGGRYDVITSDNAFDLSPLTVALPNSTWNWGVTDNTIWAEKAVPEPATLLLLGSGFAGIFLRRRRR